MQVLVLGGGYAGVVVARRLERALPPDVELTLIDESRRHLVQHELHRLIRNPDLVDAVTVDFDALLSRAGFVQGRVSAIDADVGRVELADGRERRFDYAAVCLGARTAYYGLAGVEEHALPLKSVPHAEAIREAVSPLIDSGAGRAVVGGAGLSGVQVAGELAALADEREAAGLEVTLLVQADQVAPGFPEHFSEAVREALLEAGVDVRTGTAVRGATADAVETAAGALDHDAFVWTGGLRGPSPVGEERPTVPATLRASDRTFLVGDAARVVDRDGAEIPATAQAAMAEARVAARNIDRLVRHDRDGDGFDPRLETVDFEPAGWIVSVGDRTVAQVGPLVVRDAPALAMKTAVGARWLAGVGAMRQAASLVGSELLAPRLPVRLRAER